MVALHSPGQVECVIHPLPPEPVEVCGVCGKMAVQPPCQVQFDVRSLSQSKGRMCSVMVVQPPGQVQLGIRSLSQSKCVVYAARWRYSPRVKLNVPSIIRPLSQSKCAVYAARLRYSPRVKFSLASAPRASLSARW